MSECVSECVSVASFFNHSALTLFINLLLNAIFVFSCVDLFLYNIVLIPSNSKLHALLAYFVIS